MNEQRQTEWLFTTTCLHEQRSSKVISKELLQLCTGGKKKVDHHLQLYQAASRQEVAQLQLSPMVRHPKAPTENLETLTNCSQTKGNATPLEGISP